MNIFTYNKIRLTGSAPNYLWAYTKKRKQAQNMKWKRRTSAARPQIHSE